MALSKLTRLVGSFVLLLLVNITIAQSDSEVPLPDYFPTAGWQTDSPANHGFDESLLATIEAYVSDETPYLDSILVIRNGYIVYESYYNDYDANTLHDIASITKGWTSALVGVAQAQGMLTDLDATLPTVLPDYFADDTYADKSEITLRNLLMMRSGIGFDENFFYEGGYGSPEELLSTDTLSFGLSIPMAYQPGDTWSYSTLDTQLISAIVQEAVGQPLNEFVIPTLFEPMGITQFEWATDSLGVTAGGSRLFLTPRDMAKLGLLYLHNGSWDNQQLVATEWVEASLTPQGEAFYPPTDQQETVEWYGYQWWLWKPEWNFGYRSFQAQGYAGQQVYVFPELDLIFVTTANLNTENPDRAQIDPDTAQQQEIGIGRILLEIIFPALTDVELD